MKPENLSRLKFYAEENQNHFKSCLQAFSHSPWQGLDAGKFEEHYLEICDSIADPGLSRFFSLYLLSKLLVDQNPPPWINNFILSRIDIKEYLGINSDLLEKSSWKTVLVLLTDDSNAYIRTFIAGRLICDSDPGLVPEWAVPLFDEKTLESARTAVDFVTAHAFNRTMVKGQNRFVFYPLTQADKNQVQFKGKSASLALAMGFKSLLEDGDISSKVICTGVLNNHGEVEEVGGAEEKYSKFQENDDFTCMIYPASNRINEPEKPEKSAIPVKTFDHAWMLACLYSEKHENELFLLNKILEGPKFFLDHLLSLPWQWVSWIDQEGKAGEIINAIVNDCDFLTQFTKKFQTLVESCDTDKDTNKANAISKLITETMLDSIDNKAPLSAMRWCTSNLSLCNHMGQVQHPLDWQGRGLKLVDRVKKEDIDLVVAFFNNSLVASHNRYSFPPDLPIPLKEYLEYLQTKYLNDCNIGCTKNMVLGKLYGTLMQHNAFCGPRYIRDSEAYGKKALDALGENLALESKAEWIRQYCYLTYARLDAKDFEGAEKSLEQYLEIDGMDSSTRANEILCRFDSLTCWQLAVVCRFFAEVKNHSLGQPFYRQVLSRIDSLIFDGHPWQLCTYNLGRIAMDSGDEKNARAFFEKSLDICLSKNSGPTIQVMGLLPLSLLADLYEKTCDCDKDCEKDRGKYFHKDFDKGKGLTQDFDRVKQKILTASRQLDQFHFAFLQEMSFREALTKVRNSPGAVFPFSYR